jgi:hypothetical protein
MHYIITTFTKFHSTEYPTNHWRPASLEDHAVALSVSSPSSPSRKNRALVLHDSSLSTVLWSDIMSVMKVTHDARCEINLSSFALMCNLSVLCFA